MERMSLSDLVGVKAPRRYIPIIGDTYGLWTVIDDGIYSDRSIGRQTYWKVRCTCGSEVLRQAWYVVKGKGSCKSCSRCPKYMDTIPLGYFTRIRVRAKSKAFEFSLTLPYLYDLYIAQDKRCALTGLPIEFKGGWRTGNYQSASLDRINNLGGYTEDNVRWLHKDVNFMKGSLTDERLIELCGMICTKS